MPDSNALAITVFRCHADDRLPSIQGFHVPDGLVVFLCGIMLMLLFAVLLATILCRMFLYGQYTMLLVDSKNRIRREAGTKEADLVSEEYWDEVRDILPGMGENC